MEAYKVWATLNLRGDALKKMEIFLNLVRKTNLEMNKLNRTLDKFSMKMGNLSGIFGSTTNNVRIYNIHVQQSTSVMNSASFAANRYAVAMTRVNNSIRAGGGGPGGRGSSRHGFGYGAAMGLGLGSHLAGFGIAAAGYAVGHVGIKSFQAMSKNEQFRSRIAIQGFSPKDQSRVDKAILSTHIRGISKNELLESIINTAAITGKIDSAIRLGPTLAKIKAANQILGMEGFNHLQEQKLIQFAEMRGAGNEAQILKNLEFGSKAYSATGGKVKPQELLNFQRMAALAGGHMTEQGFLQLLPVIPELGGYRTGTGLNTAFNTMLTGKGLSKKSAAFGEKLGLFEKNTIYDQKGNPTSNTYYALKSNYAKQFQENPTSFVLNTLKPLLNQMGAKTSEDMAKALALLLPQTAARLFSTILKNEEQIKNVYATHQNAMYGDSVFSLAMKIPSGKVKELSAAFEDFETALGKLIGPAVISGLGGLTVILEKFTNQIEILRNGFNLGSISSGQSNESLWDIVKRKSAGSSITGADLSTPSLSSGAGQSVGNVYLDADKVGKVIFSKAGAGMQTFVQHGTSGINTLSAPIYPGINNLGWQG